MAAEQAAGAPMPVPAAANEPAPAAKAAAPPPLADDGEPRHPRAVTNRRPTPQDLLEYSCMVYKSSRKLYSEADSQGMRVYHDELISGDVRLVMAVPAWFPKAHVAFDWSRVQGDSVSVVFILRGTMQDLVGNTIANLQLIYNKLLDDQHLPDVAADATKVIQAWLLELLLRHPQLDGGASGAAPAAGRAAPLRLDVHVTGHSLGGLLAEVATVESRVFAEAHGAGWRCASFESPGLPEFYHRAAEAAAPRQHWERTISGYLAAPNVINMLYRHLGSVTHVVVPWPQSWSHVAKCLGADAARIAAWAFIGHMVCSGVQQAGGGGRARRQDEEDAPAGGHAGRLLAAAQQLQDAGWALRAQQCDAQAPALPAAAAVAAGGLVGSLVGGPAVPPALTVASASSASRTLASVGSSAVGATLAAAAASASPPGAQRSGLAAAAVGAVAAAGEAAASAGSQQLLRHIGSQLLRRTGLGVLATSVGGWLFGRGGIMGVMECLAGVLGVEVEELIAQHALGPMRQCFDPHTGELKGRYCRRMASWPHLGHRGKVLLTAAKQVASWTLPSFIISDNMGLANMMSRTAMVEARCSRLAGYIVRGDPAAEDAEMAAAAADVSATLMLLDEQDWQQQDVDMADAEQQQQRRQHRQLPAAAQQRSQPAGLMGSSLPQQRCGLPRRMLMLPQQLLAQQPARPQLGAAAAAAAEGQGAGTSLLQLDDAVNGMASEGSSGGSGSGSGAAAAAPAAAAAASWLEEQELEDAAMLALAADAAGAACAEGLPADLGGSGGGSGGWMVVVGASPPGGQGAGGHQELFAVPVPGAGGGQDAGGEGRLAARRRRCGAGGQLSLALN